MTYDDFSDINDLFVQGSTNDGFSGGWDCDPFMTAIVDNYDLELDFTDDCGDWQVIALDRFGDRGIRANY
jgi:hypothetical protein